MVVAWLSKFLVALFILAIAGCGSADDAATVPVPSSSPNVIATPASVAKLSASVTATPVSVAKPSASVTAGRIPGPRPGFTITAGPVPVRPTATVPAVPDARITSTPTANRPVAATLLEAAQDSTFHQFGDDVYTWDDDRRVVILKVPVGHPALDEVRSLRGHWDGSIEDTQGTRLWVEQCARRYSDQALGAPAAVYGAVTAQSVYSCLGGLAHLAELLARYWWTEAGVACLADAVATHSLLGDAQPRPLTVCTSIGYDPSEPRSSGWLARQCAEIVAANPNPNYPTDPAQSSEPLPSCWHPLVQIIEDHATENADIGLPDSPHDCYHALLGYVWARQTERESRPPSDLAINCHYRAFEATP